jgi:hypothetical protein
MHDTPYLHENSDRFRMKGKGSPRETIFGVIGRTGMDPYSKSLGGLVKDSKASAPLPKGNLSGKNTKMMTERNITGPASKTHISGKHFAQVPYPGRFMGPAGAAL